MWAIATIKGKQYKLEEGKEVLVDRISQEEELDSEIKILYLKNKEETLIGTPYLEQVNVKATLGDEKKGKKVKVVHYKPKSGILKTRGSRRVFSTLKIEKITVG